jgi:hypothetical protein
MSDTRSGRSIEFLKAELQRERALVAKLEARQRGQSDEKALSQSKINVAELTKALSALGASDA